MPTARPYKRARTSSYKRGKYLKGKSYATLKRYRSVTPSYATTYCFKRYAVINYLYSRAIGFQNLGLTVASPYLGFAFSLRQVSPFIGGTYDGTSAAALPNSAELAAVFDQFRIKKVIVTVFYSHNSSATSEALLPVVRQALDFDSVDGVNTLDEYQNRKVIQMTGISTGKKFWLTTPTVQGVVQDTLASVGSGSQQISPWLDANADLTPHYGMRFQASNFGDTSTGVVGTFQFAFDLELEFRRPR